METEGSSQDDWKPSSGFEDKVKNEICNVFKGAGVNLEKTGISILRRISSYTMYITVSQNVSIKKELKSSIVAAFKEEGADVDGDDVDVFKGGRSIQVRLKPVIASGGSIVKKAKQVSYVRFLRQFTFRSIELI